jgi:RNA polymerase sigma-70 factor (ECF subfamily)
MSGPRPKEPVSTEELFRSHAPFVARFLFRFGVSADDLDDAVQEVFLVVHRNGGYTPGPATPTSYLASIAVRAAASHRRRGRTNRERRADVAPDQVPSAAGGPVQILETRESLMELQAALERLEPNLRATLLLVELEGETCKSIAASLRIPVGTVYWRLHRARKTFRIAVEEGRRTDVGEAGLGGERRMEEMATRGILFWKSKSPADALLDAARQQSPVHYDAATALLRHQALVQSAAKVPSWAGSAVAAATTTAGVALTAPVVVSAIVAVSAVGGGVAWRYADKKTAAGLPSAALVLASAAEEGAPEIAAHSLQQAPSSAPVEIARLLPPPAPERSDRQPSFPVPAPPAKNEPGESLGAEREAPSPSPARLTSGPAMQAPPAHDARLVEAQPAAEAGSQPPPAQGPRDLDELAEVREVATAEQLLATAPARALTLVRSGEARFAHGYLREERRYIGVIALFKLGRLDEARAEAARFLNDYPDGPFSERVRGAILRANTKG